jgi:hypothetical protein
MKKKLKTVGPFPRLVEVKNKEEDPWIKRIAIFENKKQMWCIVGADTISKLTDSFADFEIKKWDYFREIKEEIVELTVEDISAGKGIGVHPDLIRIKK